MPRVVCTLPNASDSINGKKFSAVEGVGMVSEELTDDESAGFLAITGYAPYDAPASKEEKKVEAELKAAAKQEKKVKDV